jgi:hypothetical protein
LHSAGQWRVDVSGADQGQLFYECRLGDVVPEDHLGRKIDFRSHSDGASPNRKGARRQANPAIDGVVFLAGKGSQFKRGKVSSLWHALRMLYAARIRY